jgi:hypothetical protein
MQGERNVGANLEGTWRSEIAPDGNGRKEERKGGNQLKIATAAKGVRPANRRET